MPRAAVILNVVIASPSDVSEERNAVTAAIYAWNNTAHSREAGIMLQPVRWETHSYPASDDRPQAIINRQIVDEGDLLIGIFGRRLGTPTGEAQSGTIEEIERFRKAGKYVALYFSTADVPSADENSSKLSKIINANGRKTLCTTHLARMTNSASMYRSTSHQLCRICANR